MRENKEAQITKYLSLSIFNQSDKKKKKQLTIKDYLNYIFYQTKLNNL